MRARYQYELVGHNYRMTELQAAVALPQLGRLEVNTARRAENARLLTEGLEGIPGLVLPRVAAMSGAGHPIAHMGDEVGWPTFVSYFVVFGLVLGAWLYLRPQDIGEPRRSSWRRRAGS